MSIWTWLRESLGGGTEQHLSVALPDSVWSARLGHPDNPRLPLEKEGDGVFYVEFGLTDGSGRRRTIALGPGVDVLELAAEEGGVRMRLSLPLELAKPLGLPSIVEGHWSAWPPAHPQWSLDGAHGRYSTAACLAVFLNVGGVSSPEVETLAAAERSLKDEERKQALERSMAKNARYRREFARSRVAGTASFAPRLRQLLKARGLDDLRGHIAPFVMPSVGVLPDMTAIGRSRLGGVPDAPWPTDKAGAFYPFVAQLDLAELPAIGGFDLPQEGLLSFFHGDLQSCSDPGGVVTYQEQLPQPRAVSPRAGRFVDTQHDGPYRAACIRFEQALSLPWFGSDAWNAMTEGWTNEQCDSAHELGTALQPERSYVGGHPYSVDTDYCSDLAFERLGRRNVRNCTAFGIQAALRRCEDRHDWRSQRARQEAADYAWYLDHEDEVEREAMEWVPLLTVASHLELDMCFWDAGKLMYFIRRADLAARKFGEVQVRLFSS